MSLKIYIVKLENFWMKHFTFIKRLFLEGNSFRSNLLKTLLFPKEPLSLLGSAGFIGEIIKSLSSRLRLANTFSCIEALSNHDVSSRVSFP